MQNNELAQSLGYSSISGNLKRALNNLHRYGVLEYTIPEKPNSQNQQHKLTTKGAEAISNISEEIEIR